MFLRMQRFFLTVLGVGIAATTQAMGYSNAINGNGWQNSNSVFECRMRHQVPFFGEAVFSKRAGESSRFFLRSQAQHIPKGELEIFSVTPLWKEQSDQQALGQTEIRRGTMPVRLTTQDAERLIAQLQAGREIVFAKSLSSSSIFKLSSIGFRQAYGNYLNCVAGLLPANFEQLRRTALYFEPAEAVEEMEDELSAANRRKLDHILSLVKHDSTISRFYIDGHTSSPGDRADNLEISKRRAELVADYLKLRGVPEDWIVLRWHGERYPVSSNDNAAGRAKNRRVTLRLERVEQIDVLPLMSKQ